MTTYVSLAISDSMFPSNCMLSKTSKTPDMVKRIIEEEEGALISALNPSHASTIEVIQRKFGISLPIPKQAPKVALLKGDTLIVIQAQLPRLAEGEVHSQSTVENVQIKFSQYSVL